MHTDLVTDADAIDISHLVIENNQPLDLFESYQSRLLVNPLYSAKAVSSPFMVAANVGVFYKLKGDPIVPDVFLSLGVQRPDDFSQRRYRSYFVWEFGKVPEVCIEIVSNQEGNELALSAKARQDGKTQTKKDTYAQIGVSYYVVFDPLQQIQGDREMNGAILRVWTLAAGRYTELTSATGLTTADQFVWLDTANLGLMLWQGEFEEPVTRLWLRWCDRNGQPIPTGAEGQERERQRAEAECQRAEVERQRAERLAERLRSLGIDPDE